MQSQSRFEPSFDGCYTREIVSNGDTSSPENADWNGVGSEAEQLFKLLDDYCSNEQLRHFIKVYRPSEREYHISGNRDHLKRAVRRLYDGGHLPRKELTRMLERAEENGRQHIFLYAPATSAVAAMLNDYPLIEAAFLDGKTRDSAELPAFQIRPTGVVTADLRREERPGTKYSFWVYKLYAGSESWRMEGPPQLVGDDEKIVRYKLKYSREILLVKWHSFGLLEIRIPIGNSRQQIDSIRQKLLNSLHLVLDAKKGSPNGDAQVASSVASMAADFDVTRKRKKSDLTRVETSRLLIPFSIPVAKLDLAARSREIKWISVNATDYDCDGHKITVTAENDEEDLYQNSSVLDALDKVKECTRLNALIHVREQPEYLEKLPVEFCPLLSHEIRIRAETSPEVIEFVIRRVWEYAEGSSSLPASPVDSIVSDAPRTSTLLTEDFDNLAQSHPYLANALLRLKQWLLVHPTVEYLDPSRLQKELGTGLHTADLAVAVAKLVDEGVLSQKYRIKVGGKRKPIPRLFDSLDEILDQEIEDEDGEAVNLGEATVYPVYGKAGTPEP